MPNKEQVLLLAVVGVVAGVAAMDGSYLEVKIPSTRAPDDVPPAPAAGAEAGRHPRPKDRSMLEPFSDLIAPPFAELPELPVPPLPVPVPPVRPWLHADAAGWPRHFFFEPAEPPPKEEPAGADGGAEVGMGEFIADPEAGEPAAAPAAPPDAANFDWVIPRDGLGTRQYGRIEMLPADVAAKRSKFDLLVDPAMEFTFHIVNLKDGRFLGGAANFRARTDQLGFSDTFAHNYGTKRRLLENAAGRKDLDLPVLRELISWSLAEAAKPKYNRRECRAQAAADLREVLRRAPDDKETMKELGRVLRSLHDLEGEVQLYQWWLASQKIAGDPEIQAHAAEVFDILGLRERAREFYEKSLVQPDGKVRARYGENLLATGSVEDARRAAEQFRRAAQEGERVAGAVGEGRALLAAGDADGAAAALERLPSSDRDAAWYAASGAVAYFRGKLEDARGSFEAALARSRAGDESFAIARTNLAMAKARLGALVPEADAEGATRRNALLDAVKTADEALKDDPLNFYWPLVARAYAERALGEKDRAVESLQEAVAAWPQEPYGRCLLGEFLLRDGRAAEARTQFLEGTRLAPRFPDVLGGVGRCGGGEAGEAKDYLRRAMEIEPRAALWPLLAGRMVLRDEGLPPAQRLEEARRDLLQLLERVDRGHAYGLVSLGWVRYYQGDPDEALDRWNNALRLLTGVQGPTTWERDMVEQGRDWVSRAIARVQKWKGTRIWRDDFKRGDGPTVGNGWVEEEKGGVRVTLKDEGVLFTGRAAGADPTSVLANRDQPKVLKGSFVITVAPSEPVDVEVLFRIPQGAKQYAAILGLRRKEDGGVQLRFKKDPRTKPAEEYQDLKGFAWPADGRVEFGFVKMDETKGLVTLLLNGQPVPGFEGVEVQSFMKSRGGTLRSEVQVLASPGTEVNVRVEECVLWLDIQQ
jgi:tetratricopeptide (TPR) repeat protein